MQDGNPNASEIEQAQAGLRDSIETARRLAEQSQQLLDRSRLSASDGAEA